MKKFVIALLLIPYLGIAQTLENLDWAIHHRSAAPAGEHEYATSTVLEAVHHARRWRRSRSERLEQLGATAARRRHGAGDHRLRRAQSGRGPPGTSVIAGLWWRAWPRG